MSEPIGQALPQSGAVVFIGQENIDTIAHEQACGGYALYIVSHPVDTMDSHSVL
jgi:hypothetical protein